ncbi:(5-formylfuran-3-yl)methyl phosphate synthase [Variovorax sp. YR752]|uniref:(5-formylfuran-3-yl)methyl phosphate synthase n=1 Tax=Variovorax sp. YR752 TaxID=1884383 RepID=UPI00313789E0
MSTRLLVSVRSVDEALIAARGGADFIDLKEPGQGALGGLPVATIREIVAALRAHGSLLPVSATIGDVPMHELDTILARVEAVGACGVDYVKVGIERAPGAGAVLRALAACGRPLVPVFIADRGLDEHAVALALSLRFAGVMVDTADKHAGSLFELMPTAAIEGFVAMARQAQTMVGIAGAMRRANADRIVALTPDFAGFRSAVCRGERSEALDAQCLSELVAAMRAAQAAQASPSRTSPSSSERMRASSVR